MELSKTYSSLHHTAGRNTQTGMTASSPIKINTEPFKKWMTSILSVTKSDTLLQGMYGCN